jgi:hypothetical protein
MVAVSGLSLSACVGVFVGSLCHLGLLITLAMIFTLLSSFSVCYSMVIQEVPYLCNLPHHLLPRVFYSAFDLHCNVVRVTSL